MKNRTATWNSVAVRFLVVDLESSGEEGTPIQLAFFIPFHFLRCVHQGSEDDEDADAADEQGVGL